MKAPIALLILTSAACSAYHRGGEEHAAVREQSAPSGATERQGAAAGASGSQQPSAERGTDDPGPLAPARRVGDEGSVSFYLGSDNQIVEMTTVLKVPPLPDPTGSLGVWPGIQPGGQSAKFLPIGNGVLQPVLAFGGNCAPIAGSIGDPPVTQQTLTNMTNWWISG